MNNITDTKIVNDFIKNHPYNRHGECFEFAEEFLDNNLDAEMWETMECDDEIKLTLPLVAPYKEVVKILKQFNKPDIGELGILGGHAVVVWRNLVFDSAGISTFEKITSDFYTLKNVVWVRTS